MDVKRANSNQHAAPSRAATPASTDSVRPAASEPVTSNPTQDARRVSEFDSFRGLTTPEGGVRASRDGDPAEQAFSIKEQRRASRSAQPSRGAPDTQRETVVESAPQAAEPDYPLLAHAGKALGLAAGVVVTEALALVPSWSKPVLDANGKPVESIPGANRIGNHNIEKRHQEVVGPQITAFDEKIPKGALHDLVGGFGAGATEAPGASYRLEVKVEDALGKLWEKMTGGK